MGMEHGWNNTVGKTEEPKEKPLQFIKKKSNKMQQCIKFYYSIF